MKKYCIADQPLDGWSIERTVEDQELVWVQEQVPGQWEGSVKNINKIQVLRQRVRFVLSQDEDQQKTADEIARIIRERNDAVDKVHATDSIIEKLSKDLEQKVKEVLYERVEREGWHKRCNEAEAGLRKMEADLLKVQRDIGDRKFKEIVGS